MTNLEVALRQLGTQEGRADLAVFAGNRIVETRDMITRCAEWIRQLKHLSAWHYPNAAEVEQYRLRTQTDALAGKLANLEQQMAGLLQCADNKIPEDIALKARELLASLDEQERLPTSSLPCTRCVAINCLALYYDKTPLSKVSRRRGKELRRND